MRHRKRNLLAAAILAVAVSTPSMAQPQAVSDDALEEVSGQGLQVIENHNATFNGHGPLNSQNNNLDSVQMNDGAMASSSAMYGGVLANSAVNTTANFLYDSISPPPPPPPDTDKVYSHSFLQENEATAVNHRNSADNGGVEEHIAIAVNLNKETQLVNTEPDEGVQVVIIKQDNNNNSVQLNEDAMRASSGILHTNAAASAVNSGENYFVAAGVESTEGLQINSQTASNFDNYAEASGDDSIAGTGNVELSEGTQVVNNGGTVLAHQGANNNDVLIHDQNNNNNSVQLNNNAQEYATFMTLKNIAKSAANNGVNVIHVTGDVVDSALTQVNDQTASNHNNTSEGPADYSVAINLNKERQVIDNGHYYGSKAANDPKAKIKYQDNNNNSVQLNDRTQAFASAFIMENASTSAVNTGVNLVHIGGTNSNSYVAQENAQTSQNFNNTARGNVLAAAGNVEIGATQDINNYWTEVERQNNNNNSVQLNNNAQFEAQGIIIENVANSATNAGFNLLGGGNVGDVETSSGDFSNTLFQTNNQMAENHANYAEGEDVAVAGNLNKQTQVIRNYTTDDPADLIYIYNQDNNNNSVQINGVAQRHAMGVVISNLSLSAVNTGLNMMNAGNIEGSSISQENSQFASNFKNTANGTVAIAGNAELTDSYFYKTGEMEAGQIIENIHAVIPEYGEQDNNNNSVQLNHSAQFAATGIVIENIANSAVNVGMNIMNTGDITDSTVIQENNQTAENHTNYADATDFALATNINKQKQYIYNCNCSSIEGEQNNNMNSVQINDGAQASIASIVLVNAAASAANVGINMLTAGTVSGSSVTQVNTATAVNFSNTASGNTAVAGNGELSGFFMPGPIIGP